MYNLLMVSVTPAKAKKLTYIIDLQNNVFSKALTWYRLNNNLWLVHTIGSPTEWFQRIQPYVSPDGFCFISAVDPSNKFGWMPKSFWEWLKKVQTS